MVTVRCVGPTQERHCPFHALIGPPLHGGDSGPCNLVMMVLELHGGMFANICLENDPNVNVGNYQKNMEHLDCVIGHMPFWCTC